VNPYFADAANAAKPAHCKAYGQMFCPYLPRFAGSTLRSNRMKWEKPAATDMRLGFEITMYIANR
jgi:coenzyme PQQ precursor peptide PqqA